MSHHVLFGFMLVALLYIPLIIWFVILHLAFPNYLVRVSQFDLIDTTFVALGLGKVILRTRA